MTSLIKRPLFWTNVVAFTVTGLVVASVAFGWTNPSATPPTVGGALKVDLATGNVGIGLDTGVSASQKLDVKGYVKGRTGLCIGTGDVVGVDCLTAWPATGLGITGSPILNRVTKFTDIGSPKKIGNSIIFDNGTKVGIGTDAPTETLEVVGKVKSSGSSAGLCIGSNCITGWGPFTANKIPKAVTATTLGDSAITDNAGNIGIGIATPARALHVGVVGFRLTPGVLPSSPAAGDIAIDSADGNKLKWHNGAAWVSTAPPSICTYSGRTYATGAKCKISSISSCKYDSAFGWSGGPQSAEIVECKSAGSWGSITGGSSTETSTWVPYSCGATLPPNC